MKLVLACLEQVEVAHSLGLFLFELIFVFTGDGGLLMAVGLGPESPFR